MKVLLDTQAILLAAQDDLPKRARTILADPTTQIFYSFVSFWEMGIKSARGKLKLRITPGALQAGLESELGAEPLPLEIEAIEIGTGFPYHHADPFDRMLAGQARNAGLTIVSSDPIFKKYGVPQLW